MEYSCSVCGEKVLGSLELINHTEEHIISAIKAEHPDWQTKNGLCPKCYEYYKKQMKSQP